MSLPNSKIDSKVNEPSGVGSTPDCFTVTHSHNSNYVVVYKSSKYKELIILR